ncbi:MAG: TIGR03668 family PPOX class F420-dependent oxidoreductase [Actinomycetota bacterium]
MTVAAALASQFAAAPFAVLATHGPQGRIDQVPCCFAVIGTPGDPAAEIVTAIDHKPKRHQRLARLANIERDPNVALIVDQRNTVDWNELWWVRVSGRAVIVAEGPRHEQAVDALVATYAQYREHRPQGPAIVVSDLRWSSWAATPDP